MAWNTETEMQEEVLVQEGSTYALIVWNDDVNTFDWVIKALIEICHMEHEQAEQCSLIIHFNGKSTVAEGSYNEIKNQCEAILDRGINASVEQYCL